MARSRLKCLWLESTIQCIWLKISLLGLEMLEETIHITTVYIFKHWMLLFQMPTILSQFSRTEMSEWIAIEKWKIFVLFYSTYLCCTVYLLASEKGFKSKSYCHFISFSLEEIQVNFLNYWSALCVGWENAVAWSWMHGGGSAYYWVMDALSYG